MDTTLTTLIYTMEQLIARSEQSITFNEHELEIPYYEGMRDAFEEVRIVLIKLKGQTVHE